MVFKECQASYGGYIVGKGRWEVSEVGPAGDKRRRARKEDGKERGHGWGGRDMLIVWLRLTICNNLSKSSWSPLRNKYQVLSDLSSEWSSLPPLLHQLMVQPIKQSSKSNKPHLNFVKLNSWAVSSYHVAHNHDILLVISAQCVARD